MAHVSLTVSVCSLKKELLVFVLLKMLFQYLFHIVRFTSTLSSFLAALQWTNELILCYLFHILTFSNLFLWNTLKLSVCLQLLKIWCIHRWVNKHLKLCSGMSIHICSCLPFSSHCLLPLLSMGRDFFFFFF